MEENINKVQKHEDTKKLSFVVAVLSIFVIVIFGLIPMA